jgi:hypothetical protein
MYIKKWFAFANKKQVLAVTAILAAAFAAGPWDGEVRAQGGAMQPKPISKPDGEVSIVIDPQAHRLTVFVDGVPRKAYPVAIGKRKTPTPIGDFTVIDKHINWGTGFGTRWIGLSVPWGMYGIHGTNRPGSIGTNASHGCIRMLNRHVEELYPWVKIGTKVTIFGHALRGMREEPRWLVKGHTGLDVQLVQNRLKAAGYFNGTCNGIFGPATDRAVREYERSQGLLADGIVDRTVYESLGLIE